MLIPHSGKCEVFNKNGECVLDTVISREHAFRFAFMAVSGLLFVGTNAVWNGLGYLNPIAWFLEWSDVVLAFLCVFNAVRTTDLSNYLHGYILIGVSLVFTVFSYIPSVTAPMINGTINQSINPYDFFILALPVLILPFLIRYDLKNRVNSKAVPFVFFLSVIGALGFLLYMFCSTAPQFPTDESVFDLYAAHLFLLGKNPYDPALMSNAFSFYNFPFRAFDPITPMTTGGYVNELTYPALSFLVFVPAAILKIKASIVMLPALLAPVFIVWYRAWSRREWLRSSYAILPFVSLLLYTYQGASADTDVLWASLLMLSYMTLPRNKTSGILFGFSLSVKQIPFIAAPFLLYFIYREYGAKKTLAWITAAAAVFFVINGYFILENPGYWFSSMIANEFAPLIGIGFGIPQVSFSGVFQVPRIYFTIIMVNLILILLALYVAKYQEMKYAFFVFPILIFLFNYRLFSQYLFYWMIISLVPMLDSMASMPTSKNVAEIHKTKPRRNKIGLPRMVVAVGILILVVSIPIEYHEGVQKSNGYFAIDSVTYKSFNSSGDVNGMNVEITYHGDIVNIPHVYFRIFPNGEIINGNMYLWLTTGKVSLKPGVAFNVTINPQYPIYSVNPAVGSMIVAYYGDIQGSDYLAR